MYTPLVVVSRRQQKLSSNNSEQAAQVLMDTKTFHLCDAIQSQRAVDNYVRGYLPASVRDKYTTLFHSWQLLLT